MFCRAILLLSYTLIQQSFAEITGEEYMFREYIDKHQDVCNPVSKDCKEHIITDDDPLDSPNHSACCGVCSCKPDCFEYGNCCLKMYDSFHHGIDIVSKSR